MGLYDAVYIVLFLMIPAGMIFLNVEARFMSLWTLLFVLPRQFDARVGPLSFCLADAAALGFVLPEFLSFVRKGWANIRLSRGSEFVWAACGWLAVGTIYHVLVGPIPPMRFFLKDLLIYGCFPVLLLAVRRSGIFWQKSHFYSMTAFLVGLACLSILIGSIPSLTRLYSRALVWQHRTGFSMGYFLPEGAGWNGNSRLLHYYLGNLRVMDFIGGIPLGTTALFLLPALIGLPARGRKGAAGFLASSIVLYGSLFTNSRDLFGSLFMELALCPFFLPMGVRRRTLALFGVFLLLSATPVGRSNWKRFDRLEDGGSHATGTAFTVHDSRVPIFKRSLSVILEHPLVGLGPGGEFAFPYGKDGARGTCVDSIYLTLALKWGAGALAIFLAWMAWLFRRWWEARPLLLQAPAPGGVIWNGFIPVTSGFLFFCLFMLPIINISFSMFLACYLGLSLNSLDAMEGMKAKGNG
jgi:hypothetical protein